MLDMHFILLTQQFDFHKSSKISFLSSCVRISLTYTEKIQIQNPTLDLNTFEFNSLSPFRSSVPMHVGSGVWIDE